MIRTIKQQQAMMTKIGKESVKISHQIAKEQVAAIDTDTQFKIAAIAYNAIIKLMGDGMSQTVFFIDCDGEELYADTRKDRINEALRRIDAQGTGSYRITQRAGRVSNKAFEAIRARYEPVWFEIDGFLSKGE